jgi:hypothetical protein
MTTSPVRCPASERIGAKPAMDLVQRHRDGRHSTTTFRVGDCNGLTEFAGCGHREVQLSRLWS